MGLQSLENGLGRIVDGVFNRAFKNNVRPIEIGRRLLREIDTHRTVDAQGVRIVPNHYVISLSTSDHETLAPYQASLITELVQAAEQYCYDEGYTLTAHIVIEVVEDDSLSRGRIAVTSKVDTAPRAATAPATMVQHVVSPALRATLVISDGRSVTLGDEPVVIGRLDECDVTIEDPNISRRHATVTVLDGAFRITDLGSTNGTKVNGSRIDGQYELAHGDEITVGLFSIRFEIT